MARSRPVLLTAALSAAAVLGYLTYRGLARDVDSPADDTAAEAPLTVETLPDFSLANLAGEQQSIQSWPGKPLLINFWATWCGPCLREIPMLKELQASRADLQVVGIAIDKPELVAGGDGACSEEGLDVGEGGRAINARLTAAELPQIGAVE